MIETIVNWYMAYCNSFLAWYVDHPVILTISLGVSGALFLAALVFAVVTTVRLVRH